MTCTAESCDAVAGEIGGFLRAGRCGGPRPAQQALVDAARAHLGAIDLFLRETPALAPAVAPRAARRDDWDLGLAGQRDGPTYGRARRRLLPDWLETRPWPLSLATVSAAGLLTMPRVGRRTR